MYFFDPYVQDSTENETKMELDDLLQQADVVSLHVVKNKETMNLISKEKLSLMKQDSIIVNTSRGGVVDESEVLRLVEEGKLFSAALDVYEQEPPAVHSRINPVIFNHTSTSRCFNTGSAA